MVPKYRKQFNSEFSFEKYEQLKQNLTDSAGQTPLFRISESPVFLTKKFQTQLTEACDAIISQIKKMPSEVLNKAVPDNCRVPNDTAKPHFLSIDFGICKNELTDEIEPQLIELQAFPSLYAFQEEYEEAVIKMFPFTQNLKNSLPKPEYIDVLKSVIIGNENPENVILLEIYPEKQKTNIDFALTEKYLGIQTVCVTKVRKRGNKLFYSNDGKEIQIKRIYNRVILDELDKILDLKTEFDFRDEADVVWVTHPNWFFKVSKYILPMLEHNFIPKSYFLDDFPNSENLNDFVLKPLFSFAGSGVNLHPTLETLRKIGDRKNYILQQKVNYEPLFEDINGEMSKAEIRLLYLWDENEENPQLMDNLVRMTKAEMANVDFNKTDEIWIGSSIAFFEK